MSAGAGAANVAWTIESSYLGGATGTPTYYLPGKNVTIDDAELDNQLLRIYDPDDPETLQGLAQNFEGAFQASWILKNDQFHDLVYNSTDGSGNETWAAGTMPSSIWYLGLDYLSGGSVTTVERQLEGVVIGETRLEWRQGQEVRVVATGFYGDETYNTSLTPGTIDDSGSVAPFHSASLDIDSTTQTKLNSATLRIQTNARAQRGFDRNPVEAVVGPVEPVLDVTGTFTETDQLELAYGSSGSTTTQDSVSGVSGTFTFDDAGGTTIAQYDISSMEPATYTWEDLVNPDEDVAETVRFQIHGLKSPTNP